MRRVTDMRAAAILLYALYAGVALAADDYPARPIRMMIPFPAGGPSDFVGRLISQNLTDILGKQVVVDNRAGASGIIGTEIAVRSDPDGYTLLFGTNSTYAVNLVIMIAYGHSDLSAALGIHLQLDHPRFKETMQKIVDACKKHGKLCRGSAETEAQIEEYWKLGCQVLNLPGTDTSTYLDGLKARAGRAHARLKSIGVPTP